MVTTIRTLRGREDVRAIVRAHGRAWREAYDEILPADVLERQVVDPTATDVDRWLERLRENEDGVLVAVTDDSIRGFADFRWGDTPTTGSLESDEAELKAIYVAPDYWGQGLGTALLEAGLERLPDDIERLRLEVLADNDVGRQFYEAREFEALERHTREIADESYPVAVYALDIETSG